jgi:diphosphomevalonate decarboxylase
MNKESQSNIANGTEKIEKIAWRSPSNIALVKYWGKYENQIPANASLSFTLSNAYTETSLEYYKSASNELEVEFYFEGTKNSAFADRVEKYFRSIAKIYPVLNQYQFTISSRNSFPHSSGIASSASSMSALALCLVEMLNNIGAIKNDGKLQSVLASELARIGSGSASRSVIPYLGLWGKHASIKESSDNYAIAIDSEIHEVYSTFCDAILIVDAGTKEVSSSVGHKLMQGHPFAESRFKQANINITRLLKIMKNDNLTDFFQLIEEEALSLHAMMLSSHPSFILMKPNTLEIIERIRKARNRNGLMLGFTLDAGANVHLLYPEYHKDSVAEFIENELLKFCEDNRVIFDKVGAGPTKL